MTQAITRNRILDEAVLVNQSRPSNDVLAATHDVSELLDRITTLETALGEISRI